ncbi:LppP/LprE family lipoprotein [Corynebacterium sp. AOP40-9SA-29]|uniref:LppP/LprE family lipoprotein n=1 Tax=Corynebacterium sp. AOP40-9SA-29 TaxID=3457677 RepID=UPI004034BE5B
MDSRSRARARSLAAVVAVPAAAAVLLAGCSQQDDPATVTETAVHTATSTVTGSPTETAAETPTETETETTTSSSTAAPDCEEDSGDNPLTGDDPLPVRFAGEDTDDSGVYFHYTVSEDEMDACQPLSWVVLNGGNGTQDNSNGTAGSSNQTVALFADGELVTEPAPILARYIESVDRIDDSTVQVNYEFLGDQPAAANETVSGSATFHWDGSEVQVSDNSIPTELNESAETLDLSSLA